MAKMKNVGLKPAIVAAFMVAGACMFAAGFALTCDATADETPDAVAESVADPEAVDPAAIKADRMTRRERKALGLTVRNVRRIALDLRDQGVIDSETDTASASMAVAAVLMDENLAVYSGLDPAFDWDSFMDFIERIMELVMKIIAIFS